MGQSALGPEQPAVSCRPAQRRAEKSEQARSALFQSAAEIVGQVGYSEASVTRITQQAGLSTGTFYYYFGSRQELFDELLPTLGAQMLAFIRREAGGPGTFLEKEERSFRAFFRFLEHVPHFLRILNEAEVFAPSAHRRHLQGVTSSYLQFLKKYRASGEVAALSDAELEPMVYMLIATRAYLAMRYAEAGRNPHFIEHAVAAYMALIRNGLGRRKVASTGEGKQP